MKWTDSEIEILDLLWEHGPSSVREIHNHLLERRELFYTTTLKTMQLMAEKGMLKRDTSQRSHIYSVNVPKKDVERSLIEKLANAIYKGSPSQLALSALGHAKPSKKEIAELKALLNQLENHERN